MFKSLKKLKYTTIKKIEKIKLNQISEDINNFEKFIIVKENKKFRIYDRKCDHNNGVIISRNKEHVCPIHNWRFDPTSGKYLNGVKKKEQKYKLNKNFLIIENHEETPNISRIKSIEKTKIRFFNHAFIKVTGNGFSFATDPWAFGPAFNTGWWLQHKTKNDWIEELNSCSFIYISHNHPDHLHPLTLSKLRKDMVIIVPKFLSDSTGIYLDELGFKNINRLENAHEYRFKNTKLILSILKSGDFREDSGLYFSNGEFSCLLAVDSNAINFSRLPKVDLYGSSFAGGASGYPIMFESFNRKEKNNINIKNKNFTRIVNQKNLQKTKASYFLPYAGFFVEKLKRDSEVRKMHFKRKNKIEDYSNFCKKHKIKLMNVEIKDEYLFYGKKLIKEKRKRIKFFKDISPEKYLNAYKNNFNKIDISYIKKYFENSNFRDNLILIITLVDDNFKNSILNFKIDFTGPKPIFIKLKTLESNLTKMDGRKKLLLKCRKESFLNTVYSKSPWEDLSIGFQCKINRHPNEYNYKFWYHFTNNYITSKNVRAISDCSNCEKLTQYLDNQIFI